MKTQRLASIFSFAAIAVLLVIVGCRREVEEKPTFPDVNFFTPGQAQIGDTIKIVGLGLEGASVTFGGQAMTLHNVSSQSMYFVVPAGSTTETVSVTYSNGDGHTFQAPLVIDISTGPNELLLGDFDKGGIRPAGVTSDFLNGQWEINSAGAATTGIGQGVNGVPSSPAGGNYAYAFMGGESIDPVSYGFVASLGHRSEVLNDNATGWPETYLEYPGGTLDSTADIDEFYLNFYVNFNNRPESRIRVFLVNPNYPKGCRYAKTIPADIPATGDGWVWKSYQMSSFLKEFGFGGGTCPNPNSLTMEELFKVNKIEIDITDRFDNVYKIPSSSTSTVCPTSIPSEERDICCQNTAPPSCQVDQVEVYIDHVIISQGGPVGPRYE